jgi:hypothetical protein
MVRRISSSMILLIGCARTRAHGLPNSPPRRKIFRARPATVTMAAEVAVRFGARSVFAGGG